MRVEDGAVEEGISQGFNFDPSSFQDLIQDFLPGCGFAGPRC